MDPMERIRELLARLTELSGEELEELNSLVDDEFERVGAEAPTPENIELLGEVVAAAEAAATEATSRTEREAAAVAQADELRNRFRLVRDAEQESDDAPEPVVDADPEVVADPEPEPEAAPRVAATARGVAASMAQRRRQVTSVSPEGRPAAAAAYLRTTGLIAGARFAVGHALTDKQQIGEAMTEALRRIPRGTPGRHIVASASWLDQYGEDRRLRHDRSGEANMSVVERALSAQGLQASGGICAPVNVDYSVPTYATNETPLADGLPNFAADRGGVTWVTPPDMGDMADATSVWTEATDASPGSDTKPVKSVTCGNEVTVLVDAVPTRLGFGNMFGRFAPEQTAANTDIAAADAARKRELNLLSAIDAGSDVTTTAQYVGAGRDFLATLDLVAAGYRYRHRLPRSQRLTVILPDWAHDLFRQDITRELAHDTGALDPRAVTDAQIEAWISARGVTPIWMLDGRAQDALGNSTNPFQGFGAQSAAAVVGWPNDSTNVELDWNIFAEGTVQRLDGGELNLGIIRDSTLDATNDYEIFTEVFEGIAMRWVEALVVRSVLMPDGSSASSVSNSGYVVGN